jgi:SAM-dependent methyltransferase
MTRVNYDTIAHLYDEPARDHAVDERLAAYLKSRAAACGQVGRVLDIGCGTGKWTMANGAAWPVLSLIGVDRSRGMLAIARRRWSSAAWACADAERLPLPESCIDYAACNYAYAHFEDKAAFVHEAFRVLKPGGRLVVTNIDPWEMPEWLLYRCFPAARQLDERDFMRRDAFAALLEDAGFRDVRFEDKRIVERLQFTAFLQRVSRRSSASQLMAMSDEAYERGIQLLTEKAALESERVGSGEPSEACIIHFVGDKGA